MTDGFTPVMRALVVAALLLATAALMLVAVNTARATGALVIGAFGQAYDFHTAVETRKARWRIVQGRAAAWRYRDGAKECVIRIFFCDAKD